MHDRRVPTSKTVLKSIALVGILALGAAYLVGRASVGSAAERGFQPDRALLDPANKFTIRLIQYESTATNLERAQATAEHLRRVAGVPIHGPISIGKILILCAGQAPRVADLEPVLERVRPLPGPPPNERARPFETAYVVNIDDVVKRD